MDKKEYIYKAKRRIKHFFIKHDYEMLSKEYFDKKADNYDENDLVLYSKECCDEISNYLKNIKYETLLDIGCGTGYLIELLSNKNCSKLVGIDISTKMIEKAKDKKIINSEFIEGSALDLPFDDNQFDVITCSESFHHYPNTDKAMQEVYRVLKKEGLYIIADKNVGKLKMISVLLDNLKNRRLKYAGDCNSSYMEKAIKDLKRNNFAVIYTTKFLNNSQYFVVGKKE